MTFNELTAQRIRTALQQTPGVSERHMFGGVTFLYEGNMCCGVIDNDLVVRVGPSQYPVALQEPHARPMDFTGRALTGFVYVAREGFEAQTALEQWVGRGLQFVQSLPPK